MINFENNFWIFESVLPPHICQSIINLGNSKKLQEATIGSHRELEKLYNNVVRGGIILLDDYKHIDGATLAVNDFFKKKNVDIIKISKLGRPSYIVKK